MSVNFSLKSITKNNSPGLSEPEGGAGSIIKKIDAFLLKLSRVPLKEKLFFVQHLGIMLKAGISLSIALKTLAKQSDNKYFAKVLGDIGDRVEKGSAFADSLKHYNKVFGEMFIGMIDAGELSGKLEEVLAQLFLQMKKEHTLLSKVKGALTYPAVIVFAMLGIGTFMMIVVVPKITGMFTELNAELPLPTKILIAVSNALVHNGILTAIGAAVFIILTVKALKTYKGKYLFQAFLLKMPIISPIVKKNKSGPLRP